MTSELDEDSGYLLVKRNGEVIANYPIDKLKELANRFKDKYMCSTQEFSEYESLDDFIKSIYFLEFLEYFLDYLHTLFPDDISYEIYKTNSKLVIDEIVYFKNIIEMCREYVFNNIDIDILDKRLKANIQKINMSDLSLKIKKTLLRLYHGLLYFTESVIYRRICIADFLQNIKNAVIHGSNKKISINKSIIKNSCSNQFILEIRKNLLFKFRLFQRKYLSAIAKLRKIGLPNISPEKSREIKKKLNKNKNVDYKAYEVFCLYVLSKEENQYIYDYLADIHKNSNGSVIPKNINNKVANIKAKTKEIHHKEYVEKSKEILKSVEDKIKEHGDIIDIKTKHQVERIRKLFDSEQFKNMTLSFGNNNSPSIGGKIIQDCKTIRAINKEIDKMIKEHMREYMKKEHLKKKEEKRKELLKLLDIKNKSLTNKKKITYLLGYDLLIKTKNLSKEEINLIEEIEKKLKN